MNEVDIIQPHSRLIECSIILSVSSSINRVFQRVPEGALHPDKT